MPKTFESMLHAAYWKAQGRKDTAGRSEEGREWAVIVTEIEKLIALAEYYRKRRTDRAQLKIDDSRSMS